MSNLYRIYFRPSSRLVDGRSHRIPVLVTRQLDAFQIEAISPEFKIVLLFQTFSMFYV